jgi:hypothetical protein
MFLDAKARLTTALGVFLCAATSSFAQIGPLPASQVIQVVDVSTSGQDLVVHVQWSDTDPLPATANLVVQSTDGTVRANQSLTPSAGDDNVIVPALLTPQDIGKAFQASVVDSTSQPLSALPFDVVLKCSDSTNCDFRARPGFAAAPGAQVIGPEMDAAIAASLPPTARVQPDVLSDVMARNPSLIGETYTYANNIAKALPILPVGQCYCSWNTVNFLRPSSATEVRQDPSPAHQRGWQGPGAGHTLRAWYDGGLTNSTHDTENYVEGETETTMKLQCFNIIGWRAVNIRILWFYFTIYVPIVDGSCPKCPGTVNNYSEYYADTSAFVDAGWFGSGEAAAQEEGLFTVNGQAVLNRISRVGKEVKKQWAFSFSIPGLGTIEENNGTVTVTGSPSNTFKAEIKYEVNGNDGTVAKNIVSSGAKTVPEPATALFQSKAYAYAKGSSDTDSEGKSTMSYLYAMHGFAACANPAHASMWNYYSYNGRTPQLQTNIKAFFNQYGIAVNP